MPGRVGQRRDSSSENKFIADWLASEDHFGRPKPIAESLPGLFPEGQQLQTGSEAPSGQGNLRRASADASTQIPDQEYSRRPLQSQRHTSAAEEAAVPLRRTQPSPALGTQPVRTLQQVGRSSYQLLWREYLALTADGPREASQPGRSSRGSGRTATSAAEMTDAMHTITQRPLAYERPKGLAALLVTVLCPPTDFVDLQMVVRSSIRGFVYLCAALVSLSFVIVPAWLWLIRHEAALGHKGDALAVAAGGLLVFLAAEATRMSAASAVAARRSNMVTAEVTRALRRAQHAPSVTAPAAASTPGSSSAAAAPRGAAHSSSANGVSAAHRGAHAPSSSSHDPMVRQVKQRIIRLEHLVFGNELTEASLSADMLHSRVQTLCTEVGVPFHVPHSSSARPTPAELDQQLQALEKALLGV